MTTANAEGQDGARIDAAQRVGMLRDPAFDGMMILGCLAVAFLSGVVVLIEPSLLPIVILIDVWLLGYHHVVSTYTRLVFDKKSFQEHKFLIIYLPFIVLAAVVAIAHGVGIWALTTIYLYWQWFHYTKQSWGVGQAYRRKQSKLVIEDERLLQAVFYLLPLWGILYRSWQAPDTFLFVEVYTFPVHRIFVDIAGAAAIAVIAAWAWGRFKMWRQGVLPTAHTHYTLSHLAVFGVGYLVIEDITVGWLVINVWHNLQYILFVWFYNTQRFKQGVSEESKLLSTLSQPQNWIHYFAFFTVITVAIYLSIAFSKEWLALVGLAPLIIVYQTINFHHYIVDGIIWKMRKPKLRETLGVDRA